MLGALGGVSIVALFLSRDTFRPSVFALWLLTAVVFWLHAHGATVA